MKRLMAKDGLTLVEVMFAITIAVTVMISMIVLFPKMKVLSVSANHKSAAIKACQSEMEKVREMAFGSIASYVVGDQDPVGDLPVSLDVGRNGIEERDYDGADNAQGTADDSDDLLAIVTVAVTQPQTFLKRIEISCTWPESHRSSAGNMVTERLVFLRYDTSM